MISRMKYIAAVAALSAMLIAGQGAYAQTGQSAPVPMAAPSPEALQAAKNLLEVTHAAANFSQAFDLISKQLIPIFTKANPDKAAQVQTLFDTYFSPVMKKHATDFMDQAAVVYARNFTVEDMQAITAFYQSPAGQKFVEKSPSMMGQIIQATQAMRQEVVKEAMQNLMTQMRQNNMQIPKNVGL